MSGIIQGTVLGVTTGDTRILDYSSFVRTWLCASGKRQQRVCQDH